MHQQKYMGLGAYLVGSTVLIALAWLAFGQWQEPLIRWMIGGGDVGMISEPIRRGGEAVRWGFFGGWLVSSLSGAVWLGYATQVKIWNPGDVSGKALTYWVLCALGLVAVVLVPTWSLGYQKTQIPPAMALTVGSLAVTIHLVINWLVLVPLCTCRPLTPVVPLGRFWGRG